MPSERSRITWDGGTVSAAWHHPAHGGVYLVLGHGAGGTLDTPDLVTYADELAQVGIGAVRFNFLYIEDRRKAPVGFGDGLARTAAQEHHPGQVRQKYAGDHVSNVVLLGIQC